MISMSEKNLEEARSKAMFEIYEMHKRVREEISKIPRGELHMHVVSLGREEKRIMALDNIIQCVSIQSLPSTFMGINIVWSDEDSVIKVTKVA